MTNSEEQEYRAQILVEQAGRLVSALAVEVSSVVTHDAAQMQWRRRPPVFRLAADAHDQLVFAEKTVDRVAWERTKVDGRNGEYLMGLLEILHQEIRLQESQ